MTEKFPFGVDTLVIPFTRDQTASDAPRVARMSRMRPRGERFQQGVANRIDPERARAGSSTDDAS